MWSQLCSGKVVSMISLVTVMSFLVSNWYFPCQASWGGSACRCFCCSVNQDWRGVNVWLQVYLVVPCTYALLCLYKPMFYVSGPLLVVQQNKQSKPVTYKKKKKIKTSHTYGWRCKVFDMCIYFDYCVHTYVLFFSFLLTWVSRFLRAPNYFPWCV